MEFVVAKTAGFCFGVKRAIDKANEALQKEKEIYQIGDIIHNEQVIADLKNKGLIFVDDKNISNIKNKKVIIRSHGIEKENFDILKKNNNEIYDLTCPFVKKIHRLCEEESSKGRTIIIIGDKDHIEVKGIISYAVGPLFVVNSENDIENVKNLNKDTPITILFQTTANIEKSEKLVDILANLFYNVKVLETICNATDERQKEVKQMSKEFDVFFIIGSTTSSNTKKLYDIAKENCENVYFITKKEDLDNVTLPNNKTIGVSAGASTPDYLIKEILSYARNKF